jgi:hypothetical protein
MSPEIVEEEGRWSANWSYLSSTMEVRGRIHCLVVGAVRVSILTTGQCPEIKMQT